MRQSNEDRKLIDIANGYLKMKEIRDCEKCGETKFDVAISMSVTLDTKTETAIDVELNRLLQIRCIKCDEVLYDGD